MIQSVIFDLGNVLVPVDSEPLLRQLARLTSYQCGLFKPDPAIFSLALERFGVQEPSSTLFVDDLAQNVEAAQAAGLRSFVHRGAADTRRRLLDLGVPG